MTEASATTGEGVETPPRVAIGELRLDAAGLICTVVQDAQSGEVLMVAWMNPESLRRTLADGRTWFFSRSRQALWAKGETSGHVQRVRWLRTDCDADTLLVGVDQVGVACHLGTRSCFTRELETPC